MWKDLQIQVWHAHGLIPRMINWWPRLSLTPTHPFCSYIKVIQNLGKEFVLYMLLQHWESPLPNEKYNFHSLLLVWSHYFETLYQKLVAVGKVEPILCYLPSHKPLHMMFNCSNFWGENWPKQCFLCRNLAPSQIYLTDIWWLTFWDQMLNTRLE